MRVRLFAGLREAMGWSERRVSVSQIPATPLVVWRQLSLAQGWRAASGSGATPAGVPSVGSPPPWTNHPAVPAGVPESRPVAEPGQDESMTARREAEAGAADIPTGVRVAINQAFATADTPLADGDELAFLPPISGG